MNVVWAKDAVRDLQAIREYISHDNPQAATNIASKILQAIKHLSDHPEMGRSGRVHGTRELVIPATPYLIPYRVKSNAIQILRIFHAAMQWPHEL